MAQIHFSDEVLMAFADGELADSMAGSVEDAMAVDPRIATRVAAFLRSRRLARSVFSMDPSSGVSPELMAAVQAQVDRFEGNLGQQDSPVPAARPASVDWKPRLGVALAASLAALSIGTGGYLIGRQTHRTPASEAIASLFAPEVSDALNENLSGQEQNLPFGKIRVISTFRVADGTLCREFKLLTISGGADSVACHSNGWKVTFAMASAAANDSYVPSDGADLMADYLQSAGAREPLLGADEVKALSDTRERG